MAPVSSKFSFYSTVAVQLAASYVVLVAAIIIITITRHAS